MTIKNLRVAFAHAFNAAVLQRDAHKGDEKDIHHARVARTRFDNICDDTPDLDPQLRDQLATAISNADTDKIMVIVDTYGEGEHPIVQYIKGANTEIAELKQKLDELESHRDALIDQARYRGLSEERIAEVAHATNDPQ